MKKFDEIYTIILLLTIHPRKKVTNQHGQTRIKTIHSPINVSNVSGSLAPSKLSKQIYCEENELHCNK